MTQIIDNGFFHADPHPGNILVRDHQLVWIDLGMTGTLSASERAIVGDLFVAVAQNDPYGLKDALLTLAKARGPVDHGQLLDQISGLLSSYAPPIWPTSMWARPCSTLSRCCVRKTSRCRRR